MFKKVRWIAYDLETGDLEFSTVSYNDIEKLFNRYSKLAEDYLLNHSKTDRVIYAIKEFDKYDNIKCVHFYSNYSISDKEFDKLIDSMNYKNIIVNSVSRNK